MKNRNLIAGVLVIVCAFAAFVGCEDDKNPSGIGGPDPDPDPVRQDTSILIGTWVQTMDTVSEECRDFWISTIETPAETLYYYSPADTMVFVNDSLCGAVTDFRRGLYRYSGDTLYIVDQVWELDRWVSYDSHEFVFSLVQGRLLFSGMSVCGAYTKVEN